MSRLRSRSRRRSRARSRRSRRRSRKKNCKKYFSKNSKFKKDYARDAFIKKFRKNIHSFANSKEMQIYYKVVSPTLPKKPTFGELVRASRSLGFPLIFVVTAQIVSEAFPRKRFLYFFKKTDETEIKKMKNKANPAFKSKFDSSKRLFTEFRKIFPKISRNLLLKNLFIQSFKASYDNNYDQWIVDCWRKSGKKEEEYPYALGKLLGFVSIERYLLSTLGHP